MLQFLNKIKNNNKGQIGVVILLLIAVAFVVYAVSLNLGRISQSKMIVDMASTQGASVLASQMASYGQQLLMSQLGGEFKVCESTGILGQIVTLILVIVIAIYTFGASVAALEVYMSTVAAKAVATTLAVVGIAAAAASLVINITVIQPGITSAWNKITSQTLDIKDQFIEAGIQSGSGKSITDQVLVDDVYDFDLDTIFGYTGSVPDDQISRYAVYYQKVRLEGIQVGDIPETRAFAKGLLNFIYQTPQVDTDCPGDCGPGNECRYGPETDVDDGVCGPAWGMFDPVPIPGQLAPAPSADRLNIVPITEDVTHVCHQDNLVEGGVFEPSVPSECNVCCMPPTIIDPLTSSAITQAVRPDCCDDPDPLLNCGTSLTCPTRSSYGQGNPDIGAAPGSNYAFVFSPFVENYENTFFSFREQIGRDDEHRFYSKEPDNPNWDQQFVRPGPNLPPLDTVFSGRDATGYYAAHPPALPDVPENRIGIQQMLHKLFDGDRDAAPENHWGFDLSTVEPLITTTEFWKSPACRWCDARLGWAQNCDPAMASNMNQLSLPIDVLDLSYIFTGTSPCVDETIDVVSAVGIGIDQDQCAVGDLSGAAATDGFWKPGSDRHCNEGDNPTSGVLRWPYYDYCPKHNGCILYESAGVPELDSDGNQIPVPCTCFDPDATTPPSGWPIDPVDDLIYGTEDFLQQAMGLLGMSDLSLGVRFESWYENWRQFIDPGVSANTPGSWANSEGIQCYSFLQPDGTNDCQPEKGKLFIWRDNIAYMLNNLNSLRNGDLFTGGANTWCIPNGWTLAPGESYVDGSMDSVISCLQFNENNAPAFEACATTCDAASCNVNFPRSGVAGFDPNFGPFVASDPTYNADRNVFINCLQDCSNVNCNMGVMPVAATGPGVGYVYPDPVATPFVEIIDCVPDVWTPGGSVWYDAIADNLARAATGTSPIVGSTSCDMGAGGWLRDIYLSWQEAQNLDAKMRLRRQFLADRAAEIDSAITVLTDALVEFDAFLTTEVEDLIDTRIALDALNLADQHPFHMIYGWQDEPKPGDLRGPWHIIKVEARIPERCGTGECNGGNQPFSGGDAPWPKIETYTKGFLGSKRCYELINTEGAVKFRTTRVDEVMGANAGRADLPSGITLWKFLKGAPSRPAIAPAQWEGLGTTCSSLPAVNGDPIYAGAFLLNQRDVLDDPTDPTSGIDAGNQACWDRASEFLSFGVATEVCAAYYDKRGDRPGFTFEFVPCEFNGAPVF